MGDGVVSESDLGRQADRLNESIMRAEDQIRRMGFGVRARVPVKYGTLDPTFLAFGMFQGRWGLYFVDSAGEEWPVLSSPIDARIEAASVVPDLVTALIDESNARKVRISSAAEQLDRYVAHLIREGDST